MNLVEQKSGLKQRAFLAASLIVTFVFGFATALFVHLPTSAKTYPYNTPITMSNQQQQTSKALSKSTVKSTADSADKTCAVKGKTDKKGAKLYYLANQVFFKRLKQDVCFKDENEAILAGYSKYKK